MKLEVGDLVRWRKDPTVLAIVTMADTTASGAAVCEVVVVTNELVGKRMYLNQDYWKKLERQPHSLEATITGHEPQYEEIIELHKTYGES